jgi:hypothetical protein
MTVAELINQLQKLPQNLPVSINDIGNGNFIEDIDYVWHSPVDLEYGDRECVVIGVNDFE